MYELWRVNRFSGVPSEFLCKLDDLDVLKDIVEYQASIGQIYAILEDGVVIFD